MHLVQSVALGTVFLVQQCLASGVKNLVVFGDSYSDTGNMQKLSNGPLWSESLAVGWNASLYSFAFDGAVCDNDLFGKDDTAMPSIKDQVEMYYNEKMDLNPDETVYAFWVGMNDIEQAFALDNATTMWNQVVECLSNQMRNVRKVFGSNKFLVLNIPPLDLMPYYAKSEIASNRGKAATEFNALLSREVINLNKHHQSLEMDLIDVHAMLQDIVESPDQFGFKDATHAYWDACQGRCMDQVNDYVWWDKAHLTGGAHRAIANDILLSGSLELAVSLKSPSEVEELIASDERFRSPKYAPQFSTGAVEKAVQEAVANNAAETSATASEDWSQDTSDGNDSSSGHTYLALVIIALFCIVFVWFAGQKSRKSNLFALSNLVKKSNSRGRFVPLRNIETSA